MPVRNPFGCPVAKKQTAKRKKEGPEGLLLRKGNRIIPQMQMNVSCYSIMSRTEGRSSFSAASGSVSRRRLM